MIVQCMRLVACSGAIKCLHSILQVLSSNNEIHFTFMWPVVVYLAQTCKVSSLCFPFAFVWSYSLGPRPKPTPARIAPVSGAETSGPIAHCHDLVLIHKSQYPGYHSSGPLQACNQAIVFNGSLLASGTYKMVMATCPYNASIALLNIPQQTMHCTFHVLCVRKLS